MTRTSHTGLAKQQFPHHKVTSLLRIWVRPTTESNHSLGFSTLDQTLSTGTNARVASNELASGARESHFSRGRDAKSHVKKKETIHEKLLSMACERLLRDKLDKNGDLDGNGSDVDMLSSDIHIELYRRSHARKPDSDTYIILKMLKYAIEELRRWSPLDDDV
ncbi:hypothetical protein BX666DRAFT_2027565 [Dichotomocladium elegans]|nr:hypothetical protein BX666DRAFT_2027565 [Dichotomocladium elegans]